MSYEQTEQTVSESRPVELYYFERLINGDRWSYTSGETAVYLFSRTFDPIVVSRKPIDKTNDTIKAGLLVEIDINAEFIQQIFTEPLYDDVRVTVYRYHPETTEYATIFIGLLSSISANGHLVELRIDPTLLAATRLLNPRLYSAMCPYPLFSPRCGVDSEEWKLEGVTETDDGTTLQSVTFDSESDGWLVGGYVKIRHMYRMVTSHVAEKVTVYPPFYGLVTGEAFEAYAGCKHTLEECRWKFDNDDNCGAMPFIPENNPFSGKGLA